MFDRLRKLGALALALALPLAACDSDGVTTGEMGEVTVLLTDAPGNFSQAVVTISGIYLQGTPGDDAGRVWLLEEGEDDPVTTDLLTLRNDILELATNVEVPTGTYAQLRIIITGAFIEVEEEDDVSRIFATQDYEEAPDEVDGTLQMPSFAQTGLKVNLPGGAVQVTGTQQVLLVDFNVAESFGQEAGQAGMWVMEPVIHAIDFDLSGSITVTLSLGEDVELPEGRSLEEFAAHLEDADGNTKDDDFVESNGAFTASFPFLTPGEPASWSLTIVAPEDLSVGTDPELPVDVEPVAGTDVGVEVTITSVEEDDPEEG